MILEIFAQICIYKNYFQITYLLKSFILCCHRVRRFGNHQTGNIVISKLINILQWVNIVKF